VTDERDPYRVLGVSPEASDDEVRKAYHSRARRLHPDVVGERGLDEMRVLNQAWAILKDPQKRAAHDTAQGRTRGGDGSGGAAGGSGPTAAGGRSFGSQPHWTGAAGPPPGRPWGSVLDFGIYAGWSLGEIVRRDRGYLTWLRDRPEGKRLKAEIIKMLDATSTEADSDGRDKPGGKRR